LLIANVIALLDRIARALRGACSAQPAERQARSGAYCGAVPAIDRRAGGGAEQRSQQGGARAAVLGRITSRSAAQLGLCILTAIEIVKPELVEILSCAG
jgi:hypothetical protein